MHCADTLMYLGRYDEARCLYLRNIEAKPNEELVEESRIGYDYAGKLERGEAVRPRQN